MQFTVHSAAEAQRKVELFAELFETEPTSITIAGMFEAKNGEWISAWENDPYTHIHVIGFKRIWIRAAIMGEGVDIRPMPTERTFELYIF